MHSEVPGPSWVLSSQLVRKGVKLHAGEGIRYVVTDYEGSDSKRATPLDMIEGEVAYDSKRYIRLLAETCSSVLEPFDSRYAADGLLSIRVRRETGTLGQAA